MSNKISKYAQYTNKETEYEDDFNADMDKEHASSQDVLDEENQETPSEETIEDISVDQESGEIVGMETETDMKENSDNIVEEIIDNNDIRNDIQRTSLFRILAAIALIYISYSGFTEYKQTYDTPMPWYFTFFYVVFAVVGVLLVIDSIKNLKKSSKYTGEKSEKEGSGTLSGDESGEEPEDLDK